MTKSIPLFRAAAQVAATLGACLLAFACPASAFTPTLPASKAGGEGTPLNLNSSSSSAVPHTSSGGASIVRTIVGLAIVIAVIWGLTWILRQVKAGRDPQAPTGGLASVATLALGSNRSVHLVRAGSEYVLLGSAEHGLVPIHRYTEEEAREAGLLPEQPAERSRLRSAASQIVAGTGRVIGQGAGTGEAGFSAASEVSHHSPVAGPRPDPMQTRSSSASLIERARMWTVRR